MGASDKKNFEGGDTRGIEWSRNAKQEWVPTSVKLYVIRADQIKQDISVQQVAIVAGPAQAGRPVPLATIAPPNDMPSAMEVAVAAKEEQVQRDFQYLLVGPPKHLVIFPQLSTPPVAAGSAYCWSVVEEKDGDYVKLKTKGGNLPAGGKVEPAGEYLRLSFVSNFATEIGPNQDCKGVEKNEARNLCFVSKRWMVWFKLTRQPSQSLDSLLFDICGYQPWPQPGPLVLARPPGPPSKTGVTPPAITPPKMFSLQEFVNHMKTIELR